MHVQHATALISRQMSIHFSHDSRLFDVIDPRMRVSWSSLISAAFVFVLCLFRLPAPKFSRKYIQMLKAPFETYMTLIQAEALNGDPMDIDDLGVQKLEMPKPYLFWRPTFFALVGLVETLCWLTYGSFLFISGSMDIWDSYPPFLMGVSWLYTVIRSIMRPPVTPPYDLLCVYCLHLIDGLVQLGGIIYDNQVFGTSLPSIFSIFMLVTNLAVVFGLFAVLVSMPLAVPSNRVRKEDIVSDVYPNFSILGVASRSLRIPDTNLCFLLGFYSRASLMPDLLD